MLGGNTPLSEMTGAQWDEMPRWDDMHGYIHGMRCARVVHMTGHQRPGAIRCPVGSDCPVGSRCPGAIRSNASVRSDAR